MLTVRLFGNAQYRVGDEAYNSLGSGRPAALLIYLAVEGRPQPRSHLVDLLWEGVSERKARSNLRYTLRNVRKLVGDYVEVNGENVAFNGTLPYWTDVSAFLNGAHATAASSAAAGDPTILDESLSLYRGEFLSGFQIQGAPLFERWTVAQRRRLREILVHGLQLRTQQLLHAGDFTAGLALNEALIKLEPWREEAHQQRMVLFAFSGQRGAALKQYELCRHHLQQELEVPPMEETTALYEQIRSGQWFAGQQVELGHQHIPATIGSFPRLLTSANRSVDMSIAETPPSSTQTYWDLGTMPEPIQFCGRRAELATLHSWIGQESHRLIAIVGTGGQGKTALAAALTLDVVDDEISASSRFQHVIWRSLNGAPSCLDIIQGCLHQLGDEQTDTRAANLDQLMTRFFALLQEQRCLLVLDGVESILEGMVGIEEWSPERGRSNSDAYRVLFRTFLQRRHRSCLLLTSRVRPPVLTRLEERAGAFRVLNLEGLSPEDSAALLKEHAVGGSTTVYGQLHRVYAGNPLLLNHAADLIHDCFDSEATFFVDENHFFMGKIAASLAQGLNQLPSLERGIVQELADARQPLDIQHLWTQLLPQPAKGRYFQALQNLQRSCVVHLEGGRVLLSDLFAAYLAELNV